MNHDISLHLRRSEAFAEDVQDFIANHPPEPQVGARGRWLMNLLPLGVALLGVACALVPPLA